MSEKSSTLPTSRWGEQGSFLANYNPCTPPEPRTGDDFRVYQALLSDKTLTGRQAWAWVESDDDPIMARDPDGIYVPLSFYRRGSCVYAGGGKYRSIPPSDTALLRLPGGCPMQLLGEGPIDARPARRDDMNHPLPWNTSKWPRSGVSPPMMRRCQSS